MSARPLSVLQLTHQGQGAGSTQSIADLSRELARRGNRVVVGCRRDTLIERHARDAGLETVELDFSRLGPLADQLVRALSDHDIDVVNSHASRDRRALALLRWRGRLPQALVVTRRTMPLTSPLELVAIGAAADRTIAVSHAVVRALRRRLHPARRLTVIPNGIRLGRIEEALPEEAMHEARAVLGDLAGRPVVAVVSRRKDQQVLLEALARLATPIVLALVGVEPDPALARLAAAAPSRHRVVIVPFVPQPLAYYRLATVAALPSRIEGLSQSLLEAMALGLPCLASDAGGNPDLITHERTGLLVAPLDAGAWAAALTRVLGEAGLASRLAQAGRDLVRREFTTERTAERTELVYREALERRRARSQATV